VFSVRAAKTFWYESVNRLAYRFARSEAVTSSSGLPAKGGAASYWLLERVAAF